MVLIILTETAFVSEGDFPVVRNIGSNFCAEFKSQTVQLFAVDAIGNAVSQNHVGIVGVVNQIVSNGGSQFRTDNGFAPTIAVRMSLSLAATDVPRASVYPSCEIWA